MPPSFNGESEASLKETHVLARLKIQNFRALRDVEVPLRPLTVLIGNNDSGKSSFLRAIQRLNGLGDASISDYYRVDKALTIQILGSGEDNGKNILVERIGNKIGGLKGSGEGYVIPMQLFQLPSDGVPMRSSGQADHTGPPVLGSLGQDVPALLDYLLRRDRKRFDQYVKAVCELVPGFEDIEITTPDAASRSIDVIIENGLRISADETSVGLRMMLFFVALAYHPDPPKLILLEEPENGVHPGRLGDIVSLLRDITKGKHGGSATQIIMTTHSPHLLDFIKPDEDQVLIFRRNEDGSRSAEPADEQRLKHFMDDFMLGEVWFNEGEAGLVRKPS